MHNILDKIFYLSWVSKHFFTASHLLIHSHITYTDRGSVMQLA